VTRREIPGSVISAVIRLAAATHLTLPEEVV